MDTVMIQGIRILYQLKNCNYSIYKDKKYKII